MVATDIVPLVMVVIDKLREGQTMTSACLSTGITVATYKRHVANHKEFQDLHDAALQEGYDMMAEALLQPFNHQVYGETDPAKAALTSRNIQWFLTRRAPKQYGDKSSIEVTFRADDAIIEAMERGRQRALEHTPPTAIEDAEFTDVLDIDAETHRLLYGD